MCAVTLRNGRQRTGSFLSLIDTGADYCLFPSDYLEEIGIDRSTLRPGTVQGVSIDAGVLYANVDLAIEGLGEWTVYAGFSDYWRGQHVGFLGQVGFFDRFTVSFDYRKRKCEVSDEADSNLLSAPNG